MGISDEGLDVVINTNATALATVVGLLIDKGVFSEGEYYAALDRYVMEVKKIEKEMRRSKDFGLN